MGRASVGAIPTGTVLQPVVAIATAIPLQAAVVEGLPQGSSSAAPLTLAQMVAIFQEQLGIARKTTLADTVDHTKWTATPRVYKGPVNLTRLRVTLTDELGRVLDLNGVDWSAVLRLRCVVDR